MASITTVYEHLRTIGVSSKNNLHITTNLELVDKPHPIWRILHSLAAKIFGWQPSANRDITAVIHSVQERAIDSAPYLRKQAEFVVMVLKTLQKGSDPHLQNLARLNRLTHTIAHSTLSDEKKKAPLARLNNLEQQYKEGKSDLTLSITNALDEIPLLEGTLPPNHKANKDLLYAVKGYKAGAALLTGLLNPILGLAIATATIPEHKKDLQNIDAALEERANINYKEETSGYTPLIYAAYHGYPAITAHLLARGACPQIKEQKGYNAYTMASYYVDKYRKELADLRPQDENYQSLRTHYKNTIARYEQVADLLRKVTIDQTMPQNRSWFQ